MDSGRTLGAVAAGGRRFQGIVGLAPRLGHKGGVAAGRSSSGIRVVSARLDSRCGGEAVGKSWGD